MSFRDKLKSVAKGAGIGGAVLGAGGALMGGALGASGIFGGSDKKTPQVSDNLQQFRKDTQKVRDKRDADAELRKSTAMLTGIQGKDFANLRDQSAIRNQASLESAMQQGAISGGLDAGSVERLARQNLRQSRLGNQEIGLAETQEKARTEFGDIAQQEQFKDQLLTQVPQLELQGARIAQDTQRTNAALQLQADASKKGKLGAIGALTGAGIGAAFGGPTGAGVGASVGRGLFST